MKVLHTSDWHIGRTLYGRKRFDEFEAFLTWLAETIQQDEIDALLSTIGNGHEKVKSLAMER